MDLAWIDNALVGKIARTLVQATAELILSLTKLMGRIDGGTRSGFNFPDAHFSLWKEW
jgi:hypothetical protein